MEQTEVKTKPRTGTEKIDATTEAAYEIIDKRARDRDLKTERLRNLRLQRDAQEELRARTASPKKPAKRKVKTA